MAEQNEKVVMVEMDQDNINRFSGLNWRLSELNNDVVVSKSFLERMATAEEDISLCFEDNSLMCKVGEIFIPSTETDTISHIQILRKIEEEKLQSLNTRMSTIKDEMDILKEQLNAKFGHDINLEA